MPSFANGSTVSLKNGEQAQIKDKIGSGGQGSVYLVEINGKEYALKWYHKKISGSNDKFYLNLVNNIAEEAPTTAFIWPKYITEIIDGEYGYVMDLMPKEYKSFSNFLLTKEKFPSISAVVNAALNITNGFRELHRKGFSYQDLNDGNFFINPRNGDVLICDTDNVAPYGESLGIAGKARYMAPEVVRNMKAPDIMTDRFSLAVILFRLLFLDHPLEGKRTLCPCLTEELEQKFYGKMPLFIYDPKDKSNMPVRGVHCNVIRLWNLYPDFIKEKFTKAFSQECLQGEAARPTDNDWQITFTRLRDCIVECPCGGETFLDLDAKETPCINCGIKIPRPPILHSKKYRVALFPGNKIYRCHTDEDSDNYLIPDGIVVRSQNRPDIWGLKNITRNDWTVTAKDGSKTILPSGKVTIIVRTESIDFGNCTSNISV